MQTSIWITSSPNTFLYPRKGQFADANWPFALNEPVSGLVSPLCFKTHPNSVTGSLNGEQYE